MKKIVIFDFDGTLVDSKKVNFDAINSNLRVFKIDQKEIDGIFNFGLTLSEFLKKFGFSFIRRWMLKNKINREVLKNFEKIKKCPNIEKVRGIRMKKIIISNSFRKVIAPILKNLKIDFFNEVYGAEKFDDKAEFIIKYLKKKGIRTKDCYYVGDRVADVKIAKKVGCKSIIVAGKCAWNPKKDLIEAGPDFLVEDLKEVRNILE